MIHFYGDGASAHRTHGITDYYDYYYVNHINYGLWRVS